MKQAYLIWQELMKLNPLTIYFIESSNTLWYCFQQDSWMLTVHEPTVRNGIEYIWLEKDDVPDVMLKLTNLGLSSTAIFLTETE